MHIRTDVKGATNRAMQLIATDLCLLSVVLKVFVKLILQRLQSHVLIPVTFPTSFQRGFQMSLNCLTAACSLLETITIYS